MSRNPITEEWLRRQWPGEWRHDHGTRWRLDIIPNCLTATVKTYANGSWTCSLLTGAEGSQKLLWTDSDTAMLYIGMVSMRCAARGLVLGADAVVNGEPE